MGMSGTVLPSSVDLAKRVPSRRHRVRQSAAPDREPPDFSSCLPTRRYPRPAAHGKLPDAPGGLPEVAQAIGIETFLTELRRRGMASETGMPDVVGHFRRTRSFWTKDPRLAKGSPTACRYYPARRGSSRRMRRRVRASSGCRDLPRASPSASLIKV